MQKRTGLALVLAASIALSVASCSTSEQVGGTSSPESLNPANVSQDEQIAASVPADIRADGTLTVATDPTYAPAEFLGGADGQTPMGFDIDIANAVAARMGLKAEFQNADFANILPSLGPKYDLGVSSFTVTSTRLKAVNFVSYLAGGTQWVVQKDNPKKVDSKNACGLKVGVETGTLQESAVRKQSDDCVASGKPAIEVLTLTNQTDVTTRLINGGLDSFVAMSAAAGYAVSETGDRLETLGDAVDPSLVGIAVAKDNEPLATAVAAAVNSLIADGTYEKILKSWGQEKTAVDKAEVNPATNLE
ncbi:ABC transporter substrate-binding protein (plasmid) [Paenarthrobacter sp. OM7]|uniref:ABC transporter substrate-binding protein n=1 Tax=Paenarthrobacter sp. OM7 TaxID=3041264 RepID=UPI0024694285|nr:ABC transporter substrate-binding protein [Paenarthrobacter sp. OM7]WGM22940.1 ABC transporter substrate-binding protein [Paenarthrobacter sp. OM7]